MTNSNSLSLVIDELFIKLIIEAMVMPANEVIRVYSALKREGFGVWLDGGWAVDALASKILNRQPMHTHEDLDLVSDKNHLAKTTDIIISLGYKIKNGDDQSKRVFQNSKSDYSIDLHLVTFREDGGAERSFGNQPTRMYQPSDFTGLGLVSGTELSSLGCEALLLQYRKSSRSNKPDVETIKLLEQMIRELSK